MIWLSAKLVGQVLAILVMLFASTWYSSTLAAQTGIDEGADLCAPTSQGQNAGQSQGGAERTIAGASANRPGEPIQVFSGAPAEATITVTDATVSSDNIGTFSPEGKYVIVCVAIEPTGASSKNISLSSFHLGVGPDANTKPLAKDQTAFLNFDVLGRRDAGDIYGQISRPVLEFPPGGPTTVALVFDVPNEWSDVYLTHGGWEDREARTKEFVVLLDGLIGADAASTSGGADLTTSEPMHGVVTQFGQTEIVTVNLNKWKLTFSPAVEVRYFIGDQSITPRRGQFLVIWFDQETSNGEPFLLGNFQLKASTGPGEQFTTYDLAKEGTAALILTEYDWNPQFMESNLPYRTGIVFDIRPEDTHFELIYEVPGNPIGPRTPVQIVFDA